MVCERPTGPGLKVYISGMKDVLKIYYKCLKDA